MQEYCKALQSDLYKGQICFDLGEISGRRLFGQEEKFLMDRKVVNERDIFYSLLKILPLPYSTASGILEPRLDSLLEFCRKKDAQESLRLEKRLCHIPFAEPTPSVSVIRKDYGGRSTPSIASKQVRCFYCNVHGHIRRDCERLEAGTEETEKSTKFRSRIRFIGTSVEFTWT